MLYILKPSQKRIETLLQKWQDNPFSYKEVGCTREDPMPKGFHHDSRRIQLGCGEKIFLRGRSAIENWKMYDVGWIGLHSDEVPIKEGEISVTYLKLLGLHLTANPCRIIYTIDSTDDEVTRFGFAFGTVKDHPESGEERFVVEWFHHDDSVWYEVKAFSRPGHFLVWCGYPFARYLQRRFFRDTLEAVLASVNK